MNANNHRTTTKLSVLIEQCIRQDEKAWCEFVDRYAGLIKAVICKTMSQFGELVHQRDVEDIFQEVFKTLLRHNCRALKNIRNRERINSWLAAVATTRTVDFLRSRDPGLVTNADQIANSRAHYRVSPNDEMERREERELLKKAMAAIPDTDRLLLQFFYIDNKKYREIAEISSMPINTVSSRLYRAKRKLRQACEDIGVGDFAS